MTWRGPALSEEETAVVDLLTRLAGDRDALHDDRPAVADALRTELAELGLWVIDEEGNAASSERMSQLVLVLLGRSWPALGWACAQSRAALAALDAGGPAAQESAQAIRSGRQAAVVVDAEALSVDLQRDDESYTGTMRRVDAASDVDSIILLDGSEAIWLPAAAIAATSPVRRSGLEGSRTVSVEIAGPGVRLGPHADVVRAHAWLGAGAVAAGIASTALDAALDYARQREQFGGPLTEIPVVRASLQRQAALVVTSVAAVLQAGTTDVSNAAGVLATAGDAAVEVTAGALQVHGGYGYLTEYPAEQWVRAAISLRAAADTVRASIRAGRVLTSVDRQVVSG